MNFSTFTRFRPFLVDALLPIAIFYGLSALGVAALPALLAGGVVPAIDALVSLAIERRVRPCPSSSAACSRSPPHSPSSCRTRA